MAQQQQQQQQQRDCQRALNISYEDIQAILRHYNSCTQTLIRIKRENEDEITTSDTNKIFALQSTVNDHRTIIDDHHKMITYLMNNTINITQFHQYFAEQHRNPKPHWASWRDLSLLIIIFIGLCAFIGIIIRRVHPIDLLTTFLLRRYQKKHNTKKPKTEPSIATVHHAYLSASCESVSIQ